MSATHASTSIQRAQPPHASISIDRSERGGSLGLVLVIAGALIAALVAHVFGQTRLARGVVIGLFASLAAFGIVSLLALALGFLRVSSRSLRNDLTKIIADTAVEGLLVVEADGRVAYANEAYMRLADATSADTLRPVERLFTGSADVSEAVYRLAQAARDGKQAQEEIRLGPGGAPAIAQGQAAAGEGATWYRVRVRPIPRPGKRAGLLWLVRDITRDRERQENVFQELQQAIDYLDHAPAGFFSVEPTGEVAHINATLAAWLDYDLAEFAPGRLKLSDLVSGDGAMLLTGSGGAPGEVRSETIDLDLRRRGGQALPVRLLNRVAFDAAGRPGASRTLVLNRAPGEDAAEDLRAAEVRFARFFNNTPMAIATVDKSARVVRHNASFARLFAPAWAAPEPDGSRSLAHALGERDRDALMASIEAAAGGRGDIPPLDATLAGEEGRQARIFIAAAAEGGDVGEAAAVYAVETTEQRSLEAQFAQAQKMQAIGQLAGGIAHDFNNVLQAIIGHADLLLSNLRPTDPSFQDIIQIKQAGDRAAGLVRQLMAFARRQTLQPKVIQLGDALSDLSLLLRRLVGEKIEFDLKHGRDLWPVKADVNQLEQVIVNLVVNARDAMPNGGRVSIMSANVPAAGVDPVRFKGMPPADYVLVEVSDSGTGIPPEILDKIFDPFFTTKPIGQGTGLGLSTVYGIVKQTGGFIYCDSTIGRGTSFRIFLPRTQAVEAPVPVAPVAKGPAPDLTGHGTVLLVEDEEAVRAFASRALASRGYTVLTATSGVDGLRVAEEHDGPIDLLLSDVVMPEMDGPTMLRELRALRKDFKVIFMSGHAEDAFDKSLDPSETFGFISKPFQMRDLIETVKKTLAG